MANANRNNLIRAYQACNRTADTIPLYEENYRNASARRGPNHAGTLLAQSLLGTAYGNANLPAKAEAVLRSCLETSRRVLGSSHETTLASIHFLGHALGALRRQAEAEPLFREGAAGYRKIHGPDHPLAVDLTRDLATLLQAIDRFDQSEPLLRELLAWERKQPGAAKRPGVSLMLGMLGTSLFRQGKHAEAEPYLRECLAIREANIPDEWTTFNTRSVLGASLLGQKKCLEAKPLLLAGYEGMKLRGSKSTANQKLRLAEAGDRVIRLYESLGEREEVVKWQSRLGVGELPADPFVGP